MAKEKKIKISELIPDDKNNNKHTAYGMDLLEKSVNKVGIIESITVSNDDKIISGNARHEVIGKNFTKEALVIETDGTQPIIIKRTDIESDTKQFYEASILANTTAKKNIDFDMEVIDSLAVEYDIDIEDLGIDLQDNQELQKGNIIKENIKPFIKTHILLSFPPEKLIYIQDLIEKITNIEGVEYEQSSN